MRCAYCGKPCDERPILSIARCAECHYIGARVYVMPGESSEGMLTRCGYIERVDNRGLLVRHDDGALLGWSAGELVPASVGVSWWSRVRGLWLRIVERVLVWRRAKKSKRS